VLSADPLREGVKHGAFSFFYGRTAHWVSLTAGASFLSDKMIYKTDQSAVCSLKRIFEKMNQISYYGCEVGVKAVLGRLNLDL
jgi:hypothetical protein